MNKGKNSSKTARKDKSRWNGEKINSTWNQWFSLICKHGWKEQNAYDIIFGCVNQIWIK